MVRKLTATFLFFLMMVASATQAGLRYCLCLETIFVSDCECSELVSAGDCSGASTKTSDSCECSRCEQIGETTAEASLCDDCSIDLRLQIDDYTGAAGAEGTGKSASVDVGVIFSSYSADIPATVRKGSIYGTRGPPPYKVVPSVPLFIRHSVFLV